MGDDLGHLTSTEAPFPDPQPPTIFNKSDEHHREKAAAGTSRNKERKGSNTTKSTEPTPYLPHSEAADIAAETIKTQQRYENLGKNTKVQGLAKSENKKHEYQP